MSYRKRDRSYSPSSRRRSDERPRHGSGDGGGRRYSGGREDPRDTTRRTLKQIISQSADSRNWRASEPVEERSVALCRILTSRGCLDDAHATADVAALMVQAAGVFSMHTSVYAVATGLCVVEGRPKKSSSNQQDSDRDDYDPPKDDVVADGANVSHDPGRNFGRLVVDGCCNALAKALRSGGFLRAKLLLRFLGELVNCGLVQAQEYGDLLVTLCSGYVSTESHNVSQPCRDIVADMALSGVLRAGPALSKAWIGGLSDLMDDIRAFMAARQAPFHLKGLRAMFVTPDDDLDEEQQNNNGDAAAEDRHGVRGTEPMEDSLSILWDVVSALHDSGWPEEDLPHSIPRLWKKPVVEEKLLNLSSLSLPEEVVAADTIPVELTRMGACELAACSGMTDDGTASPADRPDWSYTLSIMGDRDLFDEDDGAGPASCSPKVLPKKERFVLMEYCKDILACFQPRCRLDGSKVGKWSMLVDQLFSVGEVAPEDCQPAYLVTGVLFLAMLQVPPAEHLAISCHRTLLELCRAVPKEVPAAVCYCTGRLFDELERLDTAVASRFAAWFADHLKNTEYKWPFWKHWCKVVELQPDNAQRVFVSNVLAELVKLSYMERIKKTLPEALWVLLPLDPRPVCLYLEHPDAVSKSLQNIAVELASRISAQHEARKLQAWLDGDHVLTDDKAQEVKDTSDKAEDAVEDAVEPAADPSAATPVDPAWRSNMLIQIILRAGQASPTHTFAYLDRYREYLEALCEDDESGEANQIAMLDGTAQLWQNSSQWFCLVCRHLLEIGVLRPTTLVHYFFRDDNNNAIALSPFLWEVTSRAISMCVDHVNLTLNTLEEIEEEEKALGPRPLRKTDTNDDADEDDRSRFDPDEARRQRLSDKVRDQVFEVRHALQEARALCSITCAGFTRAITNALPQYEANGIERCLPLREEDPTGGNQVVLDINALDALVSEAGCKEHVEGIVADLTDVRRV